MLKLQSELGRGRRNLSGCSFEAQVGDMVKASRHPLSKVQSRTVKSVYYKTQLPDVPQGEYFLIQ
jgi:hypothetical protein